MHLHKFDQNFTTHIDKLTISSISSRDNKNILQNIMIIRRDKKNILQNFTTAQAALAKKIMDVDIPVLISTCNSWVSTCSKN